MEGACETDEKCAENCKNTSSKQKGCCVDLSNLGGSHNRVRKVLRSFGNVCICCKDHCKKLSVDFKGYCLYCEPYDSGTIRSAYKHACDLAQIL